MRSHAGVWCVPVLGEISATASIIRLNACASRFRHEEINRRYSRSRALGAEEAEVEDTILASCPIQPLSLGIILTI